MALSAVVCGPGGVAGVTYVLAGGREVACGTDSSGNALFVQVATLSDAAPVPGGEVVGFEIGGAVLGALAVAWGIRALRDFLNSSSGD